MSKAAIAPPKLPKEPYDKLRLAAEQNLAGTLPLTLDCKSPNSVFKTQVWPLIKEDIRFPENKGLSS